MLKLIKNSLWWFCELSELSQHCSVAEWSLLCLLKALKMFVQSDVSALAQIHLICYFTITEHTVFPFEGVQGSWTIVAAPCSRNYQHQTEALSKWTALHAHVMTKPNAAPLRW